MLRPKIKPLLVYYKITLANPEKARGKARLLSAVWEEQMPGQTPLEMWKLSSLPTIPPPSCELETGNNTGYARIEAVYIREREHVTLVCVSLEDDFRNNKTTMIAEGWKPWEHGDIESLAKNMTPL